ncbi:MAG TPA: branched-chain amino acid ABC transporter permease, partial [Stellaceae bacterium]|nr:branched-chain amino acid ABC transporter permease [Stellaceae bacterium]
YALAAIGLNILTGYAGQVSLGTGGFTSVPGAIVGGLIVGAGEKVAEVFWGPAFGGAIEDWFAYMLALAFLLIRPQGLFGERIIERV